MNNRLDPPPNYDYLSNNSGNEERILVDNAQLGWNYIHVRADTEFSGATLLASFVEGSAPPLLPSPTTSDIDIVDACQSGQVPVGNVSLTADNAVCLEDILNADQRQMSFYVTDDKAGQTLEILLSHGYGNSKLLHKAGDRPSRTNYDHISDQAGNEERILVHNAQRGWNYIHVRADTAFSGVTLLVRYQ